jgi:hypothetical protein
MTANKLLSFLDRCRIREDSLKKKISSGKKSKELLLLPPLNLKKTLDTLYQKGNKKKQTSEYYNI